MTTNHGIHISGGNVTAGAMAAGHGARASNVGAVGSAISLEDVRRLVLDLVQQVRVEADRLDDGGQAISDAEQAEIEVTKDQPNRGRLVSLLGVLASGVGSVASLASSVATVQDAVARVL